MMHSSNILLTLSYCWTTVIAITVYEQIALDPDLSKFKELVDRDPVMEVFLKYRFATVFAQTNVAIEKFQAKRLGKDVLDKVASYQVVGVVVRKHQFPYNVSSSLQEAAPLYLSYKERRPIVGHQYSDQDIKEYEYYVNNAKIIKENNQKTINGDEQVLYTIDEALEPYIPSTPLPPFALELISNPSVYGIDDQWGIYYSKITDSKLEALFEQPGSHTFFVPIGDVRPDLFDKYVVLAHVIPNQVLFLNVMGEDWYQSAANDQTFNVELSLLNRTMLINPEPTYSVQSNTIRADARHNKGVVMSRVLRANIPVKNGVIHLIEKPLMIIDTSIADLLEQERNGRLKTFNKLLDLVPDIRSEMSGLDPKTILAPTDSAFDNLNKGEMEILMNDPDQLIDLFRLHMVAQQSLSTHELLKATNLVVPSADGRRSLVFRVVGADASTRLTVEGGGVSAAAVQPDIGATNGLIHVIDRVLGMPFQSIYDRVRAHPFLSFSFELGRQDWNEQLLRNDQRFTYFVPSNEAWDAFRRENLSEYKQLEMKLFPNNTRNILDRHLVVGQEISSTELKTEFESIL